jgi:hypothetical protein
MVVSDGRQLQLAMAVELQARFGPLFMDLRGSAACLIYAGVRPWLVSLRGLLVGAFLGGWHAQPWQPRLLCNCRC